MGGDGSGSFEVLEARYSGDRVLAFHATFEEQRPELMQTVRGEIRYMADVPFLLRAPAHVDAVEERDAGFPVEALDVSGGPVVLSASQLPDGAQFTDHGDGTGAFSWIPGHGQAGTHVVEFTAAGGGGRHDLVPAVFEVVVRNDTFEDALPVTSLPFRDSFDSALATMSENDPVCRTPSVVGNVWYALTLPTRATVEVSGFGSPTGVNFAAYTGTPGSLVNVSCGSDRKYWMSLEAEAGVTYWILAWPWTRRPMTISMSLPPPPPSNDDFDDAVVINALPFEDERRNDVATTAPDDPSCGASGKTVWYSWTAPDDLWVMLDATASEFTTSTSVYTGSRGALTQVACVGPRPVGFLATLGTTYHFMFGAMEDIIGGHVIVKAKPYSIYRLDLTLDHTITVAPRMGSWTLSGTVACSSPTVVGVTGTLKRTTRGESPSRNFQVQLNCDGVTPWSATVSGVDSPALPGRFEVSASVFGYEWISD